MSTTDIATIAGVVIVALNFVWTIYWSVKMKRAVESARDDAEVRGLRDRLLKLETDYGHMPGRNDLDVLHKRIGDVQKKVAELCSKEASTREAVDGLKRSVDLLIKHEMDEAP